MVEFALGEKTYRPASHNDVRVWECAERMDDRDQSQPGDLHTVGDDEAGHPWCDSVSWFDGDADCSALCHAVCPSSAVGGRIARAFPSANGQSFPSFASGNGWDFHLHTHFASFIIVGGESINSVGHVIATGPGSKRLTIRVDRLQCLRWMVGDAARHVE